MKATFVELRKKSGEIVKALDRNERVTVFYRGRAKAVLEPIGSSGAHKQRAAQHAAFGLWRNRDDTRNPTETVRGLRRHRFHDL